MTPIRSILLCALLAISITAAVSVPDKMSKTPSYGKKPTPLQHHHGVPNLSVPKGSHWIHSINGNHHRHQQSSTEATCRPTKSLSFYRFRLITFILSISFIRSFVVRYSDLATALTAEVWKHVLKQARSCDPRKTSDISTTRRPKDLTDSAIEGPFLSRHLQLAEADHVFESGLIGDLGVDQMAYG
ncbi:hypothetical protein MMC29_001108 [Sticta canariensis]|nr:hypothetical protein [Sticta canariensis]